MKVKLAEALLRRKELQGKVDVLKQIKDKDLFEVKARRQQVAEGGARLDARIPVLGAAGDRPVQIPDIVQRRKLRRRGQVRQTERRSRQPGR